ncbi:hypothetical protein Osc7112_6134 [Oscillatoria nigro-viridis PCC 7112]|uniref:Uncharacterized protein n=1 Tax=Phormidium nigroviride PCC 7112 TaxID=179408 RepID=K9VS45_9CYAN|nr:hypothetical protein Osc7112_6134 [Oscillatoria nigro-viridis PCC 7112]
MTPLPDRPEYLPLFFTADEGRSTQINPDELDRVRLHRLRLTVDWILRLTVLPELISLVISHLKTRH